ncbi:MAG TPA: hypothetical protein VK348_08645 [Planctomycetota bacterium]|nr:hypothetical protein [Planctomycetota bacterium]
MKTTSALPSCFLLATMLLARPVATQVPCFESSIGTNLNLTDDSVALNRPLGFTFPGPAGNVTAITVASNGFVWFSNTNDSGCCDGDPTLFVGSAARLAVVWADLDPSSVGTGGGVFMNTFPASGGMLARAVVTWNRVPEYGTGNLVTAQLQLFSDGSFTLAWDQSVQFVSHSPLVGITQGGGALANTTDLSLITGSTVYSSGANPTVFEWFTPGSFDLGGRSFVCTRNATGGYSISEQSLCRNASFTAYGRGCPSPPTVYERFAIGTIDLGNRSCRFAPNGQGGWLVTSSSNAPNLQVTSHIIITGDDQLAVGLPLPFTWNYAGSSTNAIDVSSNGCAYLVSGTILDPRCCEGSVTRFLAETPSIAALWLDLDPPGGGAVYFDVASNGQTVYVTWRDCPEFGNSAVLNTAQLVLEAGGAFELRYGTVSNTVHAALVGFTLGRGAVDPGSIDLSTSLPFDTGPGGTPLGLAAVAGSRPALGSTFAMRVNGVPAGSQFGFLVLGRTRQTPPVDLSGLGMPGCFRHVSLDVTQVINMTASPVQTTVAIPNNTALLGTSVFAQAAVHAPGANVLGLSASNGGEIAFGR